MERISVDPQPKAYSQAVLITESVRLLFISGQTPQDEHGAVAEGFDDQCHQAWRNVVEVLAKAAMSERNLVKVTVFLSRRSDRDANARIRHEMLGELSPALTVVIAGIYDEGWLIEIEAIAAA
jgi:2-iminobutanoate/2-iminopropanoate deaminase